MASLQMAGMSSSFVSFGRRETSSLEQWEAEPAALLHSEEVKFYV
jgi:hypothetical protein